MLYLWRKIKCKFMGETIVTILAIIGLYTVLKKLGCASFIGALVIVIIAAALFFKY